MSASVEQRQLSNAEYHATDCVSRSALELFRKSKRRYWAKYIARTLIEEPGPALQLGSLVHTLVLEPELAGLQYAVAPKCDRRTKEGKAAWADFVAGADGREVVDEATWEQAQAVAGAVRDNPVAARLLAMEGPVEESRFWLHTQTGRGCKSRPDKIIPEQNLIVDLKTTRDATPEGFARAAATYGYARQAAWYSLGEEMLTGRRPKMVFIAVETAPPYEVGVYELSDADVDRGLGQVSAAMLALDACLNSGEWFAEHERQIVELQLPRYSAYADEYVAF
jgi:hypothetical protein